MITITDCTNDDCPAVAALWNSKTLDADSCWYQASEISSDVLSLLLAGGQSIRLVKQDASLLAFGLLSGPTINALCAGTQEDLYRLMLDWTSQNMAQGRTAGWSIIGVRVTTEKTWIDALGDALMQAPYAIDPQTGQTVLLNVSCEFNALNEALTAAMAALGATS
ncbi:MAG TPA: hypothetical protein VHV08_06325 [Pirellulales bacterium]|jgi:hypothetical protein|nr:hypothetical protein [Pirellulales bacterium]